MYAGLTFSEGNVATCTACKTQGSSNSTSFIYPKELWLYANFRSIMFTAALYMRDSLEAIEIHAQQQGKVTYIMVHTKYHKKFT